MPQKLVISCDWGTSSLRLQLIEVASQQCLAKVSSSQGNAVIYNEWKSQTERDRATFYLAHLQPLLNELSELASVSLSRVPVLISGMASSTVGIKELPYADVPFNIDGSTAITEWLNVKTEMDNPVLLISGVQQPDDVMRGEETQVIGIATLYDLPKEDRLKFILPGTHSKHIIVSNNSITQFSTFMTGEIFETLTKHTVLSHAVSYAGNRGTSDEDISAFGDGVQKALNSELLNSLFSVRINQIKKYLSAERNYYYLSGLLIGSELKHVKQDINQKLVLCSTGSLLQLYRLATDCAALSDRTIIVPPDVLDAAAAAGQLKILNNIKFTRAYGG